MLPGTGACRARPAEIAEPQLGEITTVLGADADGCIGLRDIAPWQGVTGSDVLIGLTAACPGSTSRTTASALAAQGRSAGLPECISCANIPKASAVPAGRANDKAFCAPMCSSHHRSTPMRENALMVVVH